MHCRDIEEWIDRYHCHPVDRSLKAYKYELRPCREMRALALQVKEMYNLKIEYD